MSLAGRASSTRARRLLAAVCCVPALALAACSQDEPDPIVGDEGSPSASASPSPSDSPSTQPWEKRTKAGAVAFVKHWVDLLNRANSSGDTAALRGASSECKSCDQVADGIESVYEDGGKISGGRFTVERVGTNDQPKRSRVQVAARVSISRQNVSKGDGSTSSSPATQASLVLTLSWTREGWRLNVLERA